MLLAMLLTRAIKPLLVARLRNDKFMQQRRIVFAFGLTYDTPADTLEHIPALVKSLIDEHEQARFDRAHFKDFGDSSLNFEVAYWMKSADYTAYMDTQQAINLGLTRFCAKLGVEFAFPIRYRATATERAAGRGRAGPPCHVAARRTRRLLIATPSPATAIPSSTRSQHSPPPSPAHWL